MQEMLEPIPQEVLVVLEALVEVQGEQEETLGKLVLMEALELCFPHPLQAALVVPQEATR